MAPFVPPTSRSDDPLQGPYQVRSDGLQFLPVQHGRLAPGPLAFLGQVDMHSATVGGGPLAPDEASPLQPVDQPHEAVMLELQSLCQFANGRLAPLGQPSDGEEELVLLRLQSSGPGRFLATAEKAPQLVPELGQRPVVSVGQRLHRFARRLLHPITMYTPAVRHSLSGVGRAYATFSAAGSSAATEPAVGTLARHDLTARVGTGTLAMPWPAQRGTTPARAAPVCGPPVRRRPGAGP